LLYLVDGEPVTYHAESHIGFEAARFVKMRTASKSVATDAKVAFVTGVKGNVSLR
jgi:hypothetical protein